MDAFLAVGNRWNYFFILHQNDAKKKNPKKRVIMIEGQQPLRNDPDDFLFFGFSEYSCCLPAVSYQLSFFLVEI